MTQDNISLIAVLAWCGTWGNTRYIPALYQYQYQYQVYTCLIPIPSLYLAYTRQKTALELNFPVLDWYESFKKVTLTSTCWVWEKESRKHLTPGPVWYVQKFIPAQDWYQPYTRINTRFISTIYTRPQWALDAMPVPNWYESCKKVPSARTSLVCSKVDTSPTLHSTMMEVKWPTAPSPPSKEMHWAW